MLHLLFVMSVDNQLIDALSALWHIPPPGPDNIFSAPAFIELNELCAQRYSDGKTIFTSFALNNAIRSLGLPCWQAENQSALAPLDMPTVAAKLEEAYSRKTTVRHHICPLDLADRLPFMTFGSVCVAQFSADDLEKLFDYSRLARHFPDLSFESNRLAQFQWLVVEEEVAVDSKPEVRALPFLSKGVNQDFGQIDPHRGRFPKVVEDVIFFLLLAPWEDWAILSEVDWRGFRMPWIYTLDDDLFLAPSRPPSPDSLTLQPDIVHGDWGEEIEIERPTVLTLDIHASTGLQCITDQAWNNYQNARSKSLFETPVEHFLVRAFLSDGIDEFIAHLTVIEAALGLVSDYQKKGSAKSNRRQSRLSPTACVAGRLSALLNDPKADQDYRELFELRSAFIHGRADLQTISSSQRILARSLARRTARALVDLSMCSTVNREEGLSSLLDKAYPSQKDK